MTIPPIGKMKTRTDHKSLWLTGRDDLRTSTVVGKLAYRAFSECSCKTYSRRGCRARGR